MSYRDDAPAGAAGTPSANPNPLETLTNELDQVHSSYVTALSNLSDPLGQPAAGRNAGQGSSSGTSSPHTSLAAYRAEAEQARVVDTLKSQLLDKANASSALQQRLSSQKVAEQNLRNRLAIEESSRKQLLLDLDNAKARVATLRQKVCCCCRRRRRRSCCSCGVLFALVVAMTRWSSGTGSGSRTAGSTRGVDVFAAM